MRKFISTSLFTFLTVAPAIAAASPAGGESAAPTGVAGALAAGTALVVAITALVRALRGDRRAKEAGEQAVEAHQLATAANARATEATRWADRLANAQSDGVVLVLSYPGTAQPCRALLEVNGWHIQHYAVTQAELDAGQLLPGPDIIADVRVADAIVVEGLDEAHMDQLAGMRDFRDRIRSGCSVVMYTGGRNYRYDLTRWGQVDQGCTMPVTTEAAVRGSLARRDATARAQGIRPGTLATARQELLAQANDTHVH